MNSPHPQGNASTMMRDAVRVLDVATANSWQKEGRVTIEKNDCEQDDAGIFELHNNPFSRSSTRMKEKVERSKQKNNARFRKKA